MTSVVTDDFLSGLGIADDAFNVAIDSPEEFAPAGRTFTAKVGVSTPFKASIGSKEFEAYAHLQSAELSRVSLLTHSIATGARKGQGSYIVSGVFKPVTMELSVVINGQEVPLASLLLDIVNSHLSKQNKEPIGPELFAKTVAKMGLPLVAIPSMGITPTMPMLWQHFGASDEGIEQVFELFKAYGAVDAMPKNNPGRIVRALEMPKQGFQVTYLEIGKQDRTVSQNYGKQYTDPIDGSKGTFPGAGFTDLVDAVWNNFMRGFSLRQQNAALRAQVAALAAQTKPNEKEIREHNAKLKVNERLATSWMNNWGGAQRRVIVQPNGTLSFDDTYDGTSVPCGRIGVLVDDQEVDLNFWKNANGSTSTATQTVVDTTGAGGALLSEKEPF